MSSDYGMRHCGKTPDLLARPQATRPRPRFTRNLSGPVPLTDPRPGLTRAAEVHAPDQTSIQPPSEQPRAPGNGEVPVGPPDDVPLDH
eukprot:1124989-Pyramimonas_sp.AAC.1